MIPANTPLSASSEVDGGDKKTKTTARKKTSRACNHCHKAHMTCDANRPCKRCYQRGLEATCVDAPRKKKKYLLDVPDELMTRGESNNSISPPATGATTTSAAASTVSSSHHVSLPPLPTVIDQVSRDKPSSLPIINDLYPPQLSLNKTNEHHYAPTLCNTQATTKPRSKFMSHAANSEYSILSDIIKQDDIGLGMHRHSHSFADHHSPQYDSGIYVHHKDSSSGSTPTPQSLQQHDLYSSYKQGDKTINQYMLGFVQDKMVTFPEVFQSIKGDRQFDGTSSDSTGAVLSFSIAINEAAENGTSTNSSSQSQWGLRFRESEDIYAKVRSPFSYTPGFHALIHYLKQRFARAELIQMAKAMASYRPSFIACTNTLKEDDLIFMEQCFQRTLLEYDKFISLSGTPTIVWRRTGQIAYVSEEFCILTGWTKDQLLSRITFIVELMDDSSVLEYFNLFSTIAYGDFRGATMAGCTLVTPEQSRIKTTCIWTLKRDVFGIPMMIIGNFLPIL